MASPGITTALRAISASDRKRTVVDAAMGKKKMEGEMSSVEKIKVIDSNGDGKLSADEHSVGSRVVFEKMDTEKLDSSDPKCATKPRKLCGRGSAEQPSQPLGIDGIEMHLDQAGRGRLAQQITL